MATKTKLPRVTEYVKNVGRSVAFASINSVKSQMPGVVDFADANNQVFKDIYSSVKDSRSSTRKMSTIIRNSNLYQAAEQGVKNMVEDIKTGNLYNDRSGTDDFLNSAMGFEDSDMKFSYDVADQSSASTMNSLGSIIGSTATGTSTIVARGTDMVIKSNKASTIFISSQIEKSTATLHSGIGAVYDSVNRIGAFMSGPMTAHLENSRKYYDTSLRIMQENQAMMREMLEMQRNLYKSQAVVQNANSKLDQVMRYGGVADLKGYSKNVKGNIDNLLSMYGLDMLSKNTGMNTPMLLAAAPLKILLDSFMEGMTKNKNIKNSMKNFDSTFTSLFANFIARTNNKKGSGDSIDLSYILRSIFGVEVGKKTKINTANYNKGPVAFDGVTRKTIVEVIPAYLARIEAALTGSGERYFDPNKGMWKSAKQIRTDFKAERDRSIQSANYDIRRDTSSMRSGLNKKDAAEFDRALRAMMTQIYDDGGYFDPKLIRDKNSKTKRTSSGDAYKKYGFKNKAQFDAVLSQLSDKTIAGLAYNNMRARNAYSNTLQQYELDGSIYNLLYNGALDTDPYDKKGKKPTGTASFAKNNLLVAARDSYGNNIFYYLREILNSVNNRWRNGKKKVNNTSNYTSKTTVNIEGSGRESHTASEESEGDSGSDDDGDSWVQAANELDKEEAKRLRRQEKKDNISAWVSSKLDKTAVGRFLNKSFRGLGEVFAKPMQYASDLLDKANENLFQMMFGNTEMKDENGKEINNVLEYMISRVKKSFDELTNWIKTKLGSVLNPMWEKVKKAASPYVTPVVDELKSMYKKGKARVKRGLDNTLFRAFKGDVVSADEVENAAATYTDDDGYEYGDTLLSARGRLVTKRGLTMISPGEIIIPATTDRRKQNKMLALEKRDRARILKSIGLNARGTVDTEKMKQDLYKIYEENRDAKSGANIAASGIVGLGASLLTGINPLLGAAAGAGISILNHSDTLKNAIFGKEIDGERQGGLIPKKIQDVFKKALPDMGDFGIAGGVLGLFTPFGPLGGAAIGAGIGFLKNSEGFKKFIFGDEVSGEEGLISREAYDKFMGFVKKSAPNMLLGAGAGILAGPFGLLGNAAMGAGVGLLASTETFHKFIFGDPESGEAGMLDAFKTGFLDPAKEKLIDILADFKDYAKRNIIEPMKNFWKPVTQMMKNLVQDTAAKIGDGINDMFEKTIGLPLHDFMQEKVFKPMNKLIFGILKAPIAVGKAVVAAPFRLLGGIGNNIRASQIRKGTAYDMTASERLAWRDQHNIRFNRFNSWRDKNRTQDELLASMSEADLQTLATSARAGLSSYSTLQRNFGTAKKELGTAVSGFFNTKDSSGKNRFNRVGYNTVKKITELAQNGNIDKALKEIDKIKTLSDEEKEELVKIVQDKSGAILESADTLNKAKNVNGEVDAAVSKILGRKFNGRYDRRNIAKSAETELRAKRAAAANGKTPTTELGAFSEVYKKKTDTIINQLIAANEFLDNLVHPNKKDTTPPGDKAKNKNTITSDDASAEAVSKANRSIIEQANATINDKKKKKKKGIFGKITGGISNFLGLGSDDVDEDSKEAVEAKNQMKESERKTDTNIEANQNTSSTLTKIKDFLMGKKEGKDDGIFGWFKKGLGKVAKFFGIGALALTGVSFFGHASEWLKVSVWPKLKTFLFGTENEDGTKSGGFIGKLGEKINWILHGSDGQGGVIGGLKLVAFGKDGDGGIVGGIKKLLFGDADKGKEGLIPRVGRFISDTVTKIKDWVNSKGGVYGLMLDGFSFLIKGISLAINNIGAPLTALIIKTLPSLLRDTARAIWEGFQMVLHPNSMKKNSTSTVVGSETDKELRDISSSCKAANSAIVGSDETGKLSKLNNSLSNLYSSAYSSNSSGNDSFSGTSGSFDDTTSNYKKSSGLMGLLGQQTRTNEVQYDENGNIITDYDIYNKKESMESSGTKVLGRAFLRGLGTYEGKYAAKQAPSLIAKLTTGAADDVVSGVGTMLKPGVLSKITGAGKVAAGTAKAATNVLGTAKNLGTKANTIIKSSASKLVKESAENISVEAAKKGIGSGIIDIFKTIGGHLGKTIVKFANTMTNKAVTEAAVTKAIDLIGSKIKNKLLANATTTVLGSIGKVISKFSLLQLATITVDFLWGYNNAYTILGVAKGGDFNINVGLKCVCGLVNVLTNIFTFGIIPAEFIMDICIDILMPALGMDTSSIKEARDLSTDILNAWNKEHPDQQYDNLQDYNNKDSIWNKIKSVFSPKTTTTTTTTRTTTTTSSGRGRTMTPAGKGHIYQSGRDFANLPYGNSTIGEAGCAPVAAANLLNGLGRNNSIASVMDAARYAENHGMIAPNGGTDIGYFNSYLGSKGISTTNTNNGSTVMNALRNGNQVIMLGQDGYNSPSAPFGSEPHYVTARGISKNGNIITEDPDLPNGYTEYRPKDVMNSMISSVIANTRKKPRNGHRRVNNRYAGKAYVMEAGVGGGYSSSKVELGSTAIVRVARSQVGYVGGAANDNKFNKAYYNQKVTGSSFKWNTTFIWWVFNQAGADSIMSKTTSYYTMRNFFKNINRFDKSPSLGAIIFLKKYKTMTNVTGIVSSTGIKTMTVIIAGISDKYVQNAYIDKTSSDIEGYGHPKYPYIYNASSVYDMTKWGDKTNYKNIAQNITTPPAATNNSSSGGNTNANPDTTETVINNDPVRDILEENNTTVVTDQAVETEDNKPNTLFDALTNLGKSMVKKYYGNLYTAVFGDDSSSSSNSSSGDSSQGSNSNGNTSTTGNTGYNYAPCEVYGESYTTKDIWNALKAKGYSNAGVAGIMGNLNAESGYHTNNLQDAFNSQFKMSDVEYTNAVNNKSYPENKFVNDGAGYGLAQWTWYSRKQKLYDSMVKKGIAIDSMNGQVNAIASELSSSWPSLNNYLKTTNDVTGATDRVLKEYEAPANPDATRTFRRNAAWSAHDKYAGKGRVTGYNVGSSTNALNNARSYTVSKPVSHSGTTTEYIDYVAFLKSIIEILVTISTNTAMLSKILEILSERFNLNKEDIDKIKSGSRAQIENAINKMGGNSSSGNNMIARKDTAYLLEALTAIASE